MSTRIRGVELYRLEVPLTTPYHLAFGDVHAFDTVLVGVRDDEGATGWGEATLLTGYTDETIAGSWRTACRLAESLAGRTASEVKREALAISATKPFTATAFATAAEMLEGAAVLSSNESRSVALLGTVNETGPVAMAGEIERLIAAGYCTLKIKVGLDAARDAERIVRAVAIVDKRASVRVDANQGFDVAAARTFAESIPVEGIELFEQPCPAKDWDAHLQVAASCPLPLMLDESIYDESDIDRAAALKAAAFVKLKLMKFGSLDRLANAIARIEAKAMRAVLGNGVASDIGCWMEACVAAGRVSTAGEMNGWLKQRRPLLRNPLRVERGAIHIPAGYRPELDREAIDAVCVDRRG